MFARVVLAAAACTALLAGAADARTMRPTGPDRALRMDATSGAVVRFDLRGVRRPVRRAELRLEVTRYTDPGDLVARTASGAELGRASLPGRGRVVSIDVTGAVRRGRVFTAVLRRTQATTVRTARLVLRDRSVPPRRTPPAFGPAPPGSVAVGAAGDVACSPRTTGYNRGRGTWTDCREAMVAGLLGAGSLDAVFALGDLQYPRAELADFQSAYGTTWGQFLPITRPVIGNHEYETPGAAGYWDYFGPAAGTRGEGWYSFDLGAWHVVALNTNCELVGCEPGSAQEQWLRADLAANPARCTLAITHEPLFTSGPNRHGLAGFPEVAPLWEALQQAGAEVWLAGHMHNYERFPAMTADGTVTPVGLASFVVGTGGRNLSDAFERHPASAAYTARDFGYLRLVLRPAGYDWNFVAEPGRRFGDRGSADCR